MLKHKEILIKKAKEDIETAQKLISLSDYSEEIVLFHCQQAVEKALKAFLDSNGVVYPKSHDLEVLLSMCLEKDKSFVEISFVATMTPYAVEIRYDELVSLSEEETKNIVKKAQKAVDFIINRI